MLAKSLSFAIPPDVVIYDLEDSVPPSAQDKINARQRLCHFLGSIPADKVAFAERIAVRVNDVTTPFFEADISEVLKSPAVGTLVLPKINSIEDLDRVSRTIRQHSTSSCSPRIVASLESARSIWNLRDIVQWKSKFGAQKGGQLGALLFASEDYCADTSAVRTASRQELLFVRSQIVIAAKASGLEAIDMGYLRDECEDARRLGFTGKQVIHPAQVETVNATVPANRERFYHCHDEILRAAKIIHRMDAAYASEKGAFGLEKMIDAPMLKQAKNTIQLARAAGLEIPKVS
ncbi:citrate lyase beta subunit [Pisolithus croceorrhizus]|nr:citrate lyase beta subunit [Pisolithus croceorrhizus]